MASSRTSGEVSQLDHGRPASGAKDSSTVANLRLGASWSPGGQWQIDPFLGINNVFDEDYISNVRINGFGGRVLEPAPGRNVYGGVSVRYQMR